MTKNSRYEIDHINAKVILTKQFAKAASILNTPEYKEVLHRGFGGWHCGVEEGD